MNEAREILAGLKGLGRRTIGCFPLYAPLELLHSFGLTPVVIWGAPSREPELSTSDAHLQNYTCRVARNMTEFILRSPKGLFDGLFMYNACDTLRNLPEILQACLDEEGSGLEIFRLHVPAIPRDRTMAREYLSGRITELVSALEVFTGRPFSNADFLRSIRLYETQRGLCRELERLCASGKISFVPFTRLLERAHVLPVEEHVALLEEQVSRLAGVTGGPASGVRVLASGIQAPPEEILECMEASGMVIVANDIATLSRSYGFKGIPCEDPCEYYCNFYFNAHPCTTMLHAGDSRAEHIRNMAESNSAQGFIFFGEKFCEYEYFEIPYIRDMLRGLGVDTLFLEIGPDDITNLMSFRTRVEAFSEMLKAKQGAQGVRHGN